VKEGSRLFAGAGLFSLGEGKNLRLSEHSVQIGDDEQ
jgi:hypothetical protein